MQPPVSRVLITGATGFIGSRLALYAHSCGLCVTALGLVRNETERARSRELTDAGLTVVNANLDDVGTLRFVLNSQDVVVHLAAAQHEAHLPEAHFQSVNVEGTRRLLQLAEETGVRRFVYGSTIGVYGEASTHELSETDAVAPTNPYTRSKVDAEQVALEAAERLEVVVARISEVYGPGDLRLLKLFRAIEQGTYRTIGDGRNLRQPIYIDDLCHALINLACSSGCAGETFILAGDERLTTDAMAAAIGRAVGKPVSRMHLPALPFRAVAAFGEALLQPAGIRPPLNSRRLDFFLKSFRLSNDKAHRLLGFSSRVSFEEGARRTARWYRMSCLLKDLGETTPSSLREPSVQPMGRGPAIRSGDPDPTRVLIAATGAGLALILLWRLQHRLGPFALGLFEKEGPFELLTFGLEVLGAAWCVSTVWRLTQQSDTGGRAVRLVFGALGAILFLVAMEEINWGQTLIGFRTPEAWAAINYQQETSIHNLVDKTVLTRAWKAISVLFGVSVLALAAIRARAPESVIGRIAPHPALVPLALCVTFAGLRQHPEMVELLLSVFFAFYTYRIWSMARYSAHVVPAAQPESPEAVSTPHAGRIVRLIVAAGLIALLLSRFDWSETEHIVSIASVPLLFGAFVAMTLTLLFSAWKWNWALRLHELRFDFPFVLRTLSIGFFLNHFLPTAVGGDAYRVLQTLPRDGFRSRALSAVIVERLVGLCALLIIGAVAALRLMETRGVMHEYMYGLGAALALTTIAVLALRSDWTRRITLRWHSVPAVRTLHHNLGLLQTHPREWSGLILGSFAFQLLSIGIIFVLFGALGTNATPAQCAVIAAMVGLAASLPISINGIGVMEGAFVATAVALRIDFEHALFVALLRRAMAIVLAVPCGALWFMQGRNLRPHAGPGELMRYFAAWKRAGMRGLLDELQPVAASPSSIVPMNEAMPDVPLAASESDGGLSHAALLEYTHDAIVIWEMQGRGILYWNRAAEQLYGYSREEALGKVTHSLLRTAVTGGIVALESALSRYGVWIGELQHTARDGRKVEVEARLSLMSHQNGRWLVLEVNRDVTDRNAAESARRRIEKQLAELRAMIDTRPGG
jgi:dihydroflavonol-4-reductase